MTALQQAYDFKTPVEMALALDFAASEIKVRAVANDGFATNAWREANPTVQDKILGMSFQDFRPRVEIVVRVGPAAGRNLPDSEGQFQPIGGFCHDFGRGLAVGIKVITKADILEHRAFESQIRGLMATVLRRINGDLTIDGAIAGQQLTLHRIPELAEAGSTEAYTPQEGVYQTDLTYAGQITMQEDTLTALT